MINPSFSAVVMMSESTAMNSTGSTNEVKPIDEAAQAMIAFCKHTVFDVTYAYVNGTYFIIN